ncbi:hypothetical protein BC830DRAFT_1229566 [Chytriomyces sp. MP71]|nr:hypothetical protein BC830DRAFT_1229566 [Chytriomyces sp. MP71]
MAAGLGHLAMQTAWKRYSLESSSTMAEIRIMPTEEGKSDWMSAVSRAESEQVEPSSSERASVVDETSPADHSRAQSTQSGNYVLENLDKKVKYGAGKIVTGTAVAV